MHRCITSYCRTCGQTFQVGRRRWTTSSKGKQAASSCNLLKAAIQLAAEVPVRTLSSPALARLGARLCWWTINLKKLCVADEIHYQYNSWSFFFWSSKRRQNR